MGESPAPARPVCRSCGLDLCGESHAQCNGTFFCARCYVRANVVLRMPVFNSPYYFALKSYEADK